MFSGARINGKGSDLYQLCTELDDIIARKSNAVRLYCIDGNQTSSHFECSVSVSVLRYWCASFVRYSITFLHYIYALLERDQNAPSSQLPESADWIPDGFWDNKSSTQYDAVDIKSSEKQLTRELIATLLLQHCSLYSGCRFILYILAMYKYNYAPVYDIAFRYVGRLPTFGWGGRRETTQWNDAFGDVHDRSTVMTSHDNITLTWFQCVS